MIRQDMFSSLVVNFVLFVATLLYYYMLYCNVKDA
jgi:hypothetical protein